MTTIEILHGYRGKRTNEEYLPAGEHEVSEDLATYLIENKHARLVHPLLTPKPARKRKVQPIPAMKSEGKL